MLLTIDVGNTHTVLGLFEGEDVIEHWRINTDARRTADEIAVVLQGLVQQSPLLAETDISGIALCSTVPSVLHEMREMCRRYYGDVPAVIVEPGVKTGVPVRMDNPKEVGSDRIINTLATTHIYGGPAVVVDFGTATTFDAVSAKGEYVGGAIAPGIEISVDALSHARRAAAQGGARTAPQRHRQEHGRGAAVGHHLRLRRPGGRRGRADVRGARRQSRGRHRGGHRRPRAARAGRGPHDRRVRAVAHPDRPAPGVRAQRRRLGARAE